MTQKEGSSVEANIHSELTSEQETKLDHIVDTTGCSYDDARRLMGVTSRRPKACYGATYEESEIY